MNIILKTFIRASFLVPTVTLLGVSRVASELAYYLPEVALQAEKLADVGRLSMQDHLTLVGEMGLSDGLEAAQAMLDHRLMAMRSGHPVTLQ